MYNILTFSGPKAWSALRSEPLRSHQNEGAYADQDGKTQSGRTSRFGDRIAPGKEMSDIVISLWKNMGDWNNDRRFL